MIFASRVFLGESIKDDPSGIIKKLKKNRLMKGVYIISPAENGVDPLEYYDTIQLNQSHYRNRELKIIGIARSEKEAIQLVSEIYEASVEYGHETIGSYVRELFS
ncbi:MAG: hypothetical protein IJT24_03095 [Lachnospiraceae bacterium]|nr:hypothetical protein [Lachnospiraceae bacterium]